MQQQRKGKDGIEMKPLDHQATHCCALLFDKSTLYYIRVKKGKSDYFLSNTRRHTHLENETC